MWRNGDSNNNSDISRLHIRYSQAVLHRLQYGVYIQEQRTGGKLYHRVRRRAIQSADPRLPVIRRSTSFTKVKYYGTLATPSEISCQEAPANPAHSKSV